MKSHYVATLKIDADRELVDVELRAGIEYSLEGLRIVYQRYTHKLPNGRKTRSAYIGTRENQQRDETSSRNK